MRFLQTGLAGSWLIETEPQSDERGYFARTFCAAEFAAHGIEANVSQCSTSFNARRGTLRGMHYQEGDAAEDKLVRCTRGAIHDVIVDLRPASPTRFRWYAAELTADNGRMLFAPRGFAHGFMALEDASEVLYQMAQPYVPGAGRGVRWNDPRLAIRWPDIAPVLSERDRTYPDLAP